MHDPKRILILRRKAIGDVVVSLAVARALRRQWPEARLEMLVDRFAAPVAQGCSELDEVVVYDRRRMSQGNPISRALNIRRFLLGLRQRRYDIVLDLMGTPQTAIWTRVIGAPIRIGRRRRFRSWAYTHVMPPDDGPTRFAGDVFLDWLRPLGIEPGPWVPVPIVASRKEQTREDRVLADHAREDRARIDHARNDRARTGSDQPFVVLNPSATWSAKAWPSSSFAALAKQLHEGLGAKVEIAWGPGEEADRDSIVAAASGSAVAMPPTDLPALAARLDQADLLITTDSGPKHIAVAQGTPTLTLFGSTDPAGWQPPGDLHEGISHEVECRPCDLTECPVPGHPCLDDLSAERVYARAISMLSRQSQGARA